MTRSERKALACIVVLLVFGGALYLIGGHIQANKLQRSKELKERERAEKTIVYPIGSAAHIDSEDINERWGDSGNFWIWDGAMDVSIVALELHSSLESTGIDPQSASMPGDISDPVFIKLVIDYKNESAKPFKWDYFLFSPGFDFYSPLAYFDGSVEAPELNGSNYFQLAKGEQRTFCSLFVAAQSDIDTWLKTDNTTVKFLPSMYLAARVTDLR